MPHIQQLDPHVADLIAAGEVVEQDEKVEALEFSVTPDISFAGVPLRDLNLKRGLLLAGIVRQNGQIVIPSGNDVLHLHDDVIVVTTDTQLEDLRDILAE